MKNIMQSNLSTLLKLASIGGLSLLTACASTTPAWDAQFGDTVRSSVSQQTINPEASQNTDPVKGIDGPAAEYTIERYKESFKKPEPQSNVFTIGVSGSSSGSTTTGK